MSYLKAFLVLGYLYWPFFTTSLTILSREASLVKNVRAPVASITDTSNDGWTKFITLAVSTITTTSPEARPRFIRGVISEAQGELTKKTDIIFSTVHGDQIMTSSRNPDLKWSNAVPVPAGYQYPVQARTSYFIWQQVADASTGWDEVALRLYKAGAFIEYTDYYSTCEVYEERVGAELYPWWHFSNPVSDFGARYEASCVNARTQEIDLGCKKFAPSDSVVSI